jgi:DNA-binding NtrC family response regulator
MNISTGHILLVDDEEGIRFTLGSLLRNEGFQVSVAANREEALAHVRATNFDLTFLDIMLGEESGLELLREIKLATPATQVIMFTGCPHVDTAAEAVRQGAPWTI